MTVQELALMIGACAAVAGIFYNARRIDELQKALTEEKNERKEERKNAQLRESIDRQNIILMGESMSNIRLDNAKLALAFNQLYNEFEKATGNKPPVDIEMLKHMRTLEYITGPLGPIEIVEQ